MISADNLRCLMPWKALYMDERNGRLSALPCCANWINRKYGLIEKTTPLADLWNGPGAQEIRRLMAQGAQNELCAPDCPWLVSGRFAEAAIDIIPGPTEFVRNQLLNQEEIRQRRTVLESKPMAIRIIPTLRCNIRCRMCHQNHQAKLSLPETFMTEVYSLGPYIYDYQLHGGEVLIASQFSEWASPAWFAANPQMLLSLITNATRVPKKTLEVLRQIRINYITVSINAATRETYQHIAGADLFKSVIRNIILLRDLGKAHELFPFGVYLSFVIMRSNYHEIPGFVRLAQRLELPFRLLLVVGDRSGESIYTGPPVLKKVLDHLAEATPLAPEHSLPEITRVQQSLREMLDPHEAAR